MVEVLLKCLQKPGWISRLLKVVLASQNAPFNGHSRQYMNRSWKISELLIFDNTSLVSEQNYSNHPLSIEYIDLFPSQAEMILVDS